MEEREARIALNMTEHVGPVRLRQLLRYFDTPVEILKASRSALERIPGIGSETVGAIVSWESAIDLKGELKRIEQFGCTVLIPSDTSYPALLREIYDPPIVLYMKGKLGASCNRSVALVGSRMTTHYGLDCAKRLSSQLASLGIPVVSGGARGIDTAAHHGALKVGGITVAVLGTGINLVFPAENAELFARISTQGAVLTQFPFNRKADRQSFPIRNRIVAGMTLGTVVIEANLTSGALITANMAVENGRQVFAVPGRIDSPRSKGCHDLIKKGAKCCESAQDILSEFEYLFPPSQFQNRQSQPLLSSTTPLSEEECILLNCFETDEVHIDTLIEMSGFSPGRVAALLLNLELNQKIRRFPGKRFGKMLQL